MAEKENKFLMDHIFQIRDDYYHLRDAIADSNPAVFNELMELRKDLSCLSLDLANETGEKMRAHKAAKSKLEITRYLKQKELMDKGVKVTAAEAQAKHQVTDLIDDESLKEGEYMSSRLILNQVNEILASMKQDISIIKREYESMGDRE